MKRGGNSQQPFSNPVKEQPGNNQSAEKLPDTDRGQKTLTRRCRGPGLIAQARGAEHAIVVFSNTLTAKGVLAFRAAGDRLT
jgi:hypothetical protein